MPEQHLYLVPPLPTLEELSKKLWTESPGLRERSAKALREAEALLGEVVARNAIIATIE